MQSEPLSEPLTSVSVPDAQILREVIEGKTCAFEILVERYQGMVYAVAWSRLRNDAVAEEVVQETFLLAYQNLASLRNPEKFGAWLCTIARNLSKRSARRALREQVAMANLAEEISQRSPDHQPAYEIMPAMDGLKAEYRKALTLYYLQGFNISECARFLGLAETNFKTRLHRARGQLKTELLEQNLADLSQTPNLTNTKEQIMALLPLTAVVGKGGALQGLSVLFSPPFLMSLPISVAWLSHRAQIMNFRSHAELRRKVARNAYHTGWCIVGILLIGFVYITHTWSIEAGQLALGLYLLCSIVAMVPQLQICRTRFLKGMFLGSSAIAVSLLLAGSGLLPPTAGFVGVYIHVVLLFFGRKSLPTRADYNLFQRHCMGLLSPAEPTSSSVPLTQHELNAFTRFLGDQYLAIDRTRSSDGYCVYLPAVRTKARSTLALLPGRWVDSSFIEISTNGMCQAHISRSDFKVLSALCNTQATPAELESSVSSTVQNSLSAFTRGDMASAGEILQNESLAETYNQAPWEVGPTKWIMTIGVVSSVFGLVLLTFRLLF